MNRMNDGDSVATVERDCFTCGDRFSDFADIFECPKCLPRGHRQCLNPDCLLEYYDVYDYLGCPLCEPRHHRIPVRFAESVVRTAMRAFDRGDVMCVPGVVNQAGVTSVRLAPRFAVRRILDPVFRKR